MIIGAPKEQNLSNHGQDIELRVALDPQAAKRLTQLKGAKVVVENGLGEHLGYSDDDYSKAGAEIKSRSEVLKADIQLRVNKPSVEEIKELNQFNQHNQQEKEKIHISHLDPFNEKEIVLALKEAQITAISLEMIPRTTRAQKMDALSSQANLAGYVAVVLAADNLSKIFPMMMTPSGTISPSRVFVIGAGVAGLQAIATAKRLGARVEAFDTRPVVEEQVKSLGAKFVKVDLGETGQTKDGYAKELTPEQIKLQKEVMAKHCAEADVVITTAQLFGRKAPIIIDDPMIAQMKPGSIIVDLAVSSGGNVTLSKNGEIVDSPNGVKIIGLSHLTSRVAVHATQMVASNLTHFITEFWDQEQERWVYKEDDEIIQGCVITRKGEVVNDRIKNHYES